MASVTLGFGLFCVLLPIAGIVLAIVLVHRAQVRRREGLQSYAGAREWRFTPDGTGLEDRWQGDPFGRGHRRQARNVIEGSYEGQHFLAFDYSYVTGSGDDSTHHSCSVVTMPLGLAVPTLQVSPQGAIGRFFSTLFGTDLVIGSPGFDEAFRVRAGDPRFAQDVLHPGMTALLAAYQDRAWRLQGDSLLMFRAGSHSPAEIDAVLASMRAILAQVPASVWGRLRGDG